VERDITDLSDICLDVVSGSLTGLMIAVLIGVLFIQSNIGTDIFGGFYFLSLLLGFCASGWNGVYFGDLAKATTHAAISRVTGKALIFTFAGVVIGPSAFGWLLSSVGTNGALFSLGSAAVIGSLFAWWGSSYSSTVVS